MSTNKTAYVRAVPQSAGLPNPQVQIAIAVDTAYIAANYNKGISTGIYMMDNMLNQDSSGEGTLELHTRCPVGSLIGFSVYPMDQNSGDTVQITGFNVSAGNVFGSAGYPLELNPGYWIGQAINSGSQTYQIQIKVTTGGLRPISYYVNWDPFITAQ